MQNREHICLVFVCCFAIADAESHLLNTTKAVGTAYFGLRKNDNFRWTVTPPKSGEDLALVLFIINTPNYQSGKVIYMPDGNILPHQTIKYQEPNKAWCGVYVPPNTKSCPEGVIYKDVCDKAANVSSEWPPTVTGRGSNVFYVLFTYTFVSCSASDRSNPGTGTTSQCDPMTGTFVVLGILLAISVILSTVLLIKAIRDKRHKSPIKEKKPSSGPVEQRINSASGQSRANPSLQTAIEDTYQTPHFMEETNHENQYQGLSKPSEDPSMAYSKLAR